VISRKDGTATQNESVAPILTLANVVMIDPARMIVLRRPQ
jgi:hypothetical protein